MSLVHEKQVLRQQVIEQCNQLSGIDRVNKEDLTLQNIIPLLNQVKSVMLYHAHGYELNPKSIYTYCSSHHKQIFQPVAYKTTNEMKIAQYNENNTNIFSALDCEIEDSIQWYNIGLIILPLVAVDNYGNRLGKGGGYYDRTLANLKQRNNILCGIGFSCQLIQEQLPNEDFDIKIDYFASDKGLIKF
ncbi:MAG: 5-formyltetrahydrofolate cyclo-ligase [Burkholderiales bacterium]|nr:5-formyltetrahydrofolate cyclo-ligase [Burkholderiales bacterium]